MEKLEGSIVSTVFRNEENGWSVISVHSGNKDITVVGTLPDLAPGEQAVFTGDWTTHRVYGSQFRCDSYEILLPTTLLGIQRFLGSGLIKGIGKGLAEKIVEHFGEETLTVLSEHPERLMEVRGIGRTSYKSIAESYRETQATRESLVSLQRYGISPALAQKITERYGLQGPEIVQEDPYRLCDEIEGIGFKTADRIATALGIAPDSDQRVACALRYLLREAADSSGHCYLPADDLCRRAADLLQVPPELCRRQLTALTLRNRLCTEEEGPEQRVYLPGFYRAEQEVALRLCRLMWAVRASQHPRARQEISAFEQAHGISFSPNQRKAILAAIENGVFVITGGPGTGKTTIINCILRLLRPEGEIMLCAPTGRAAKRMTEATGVDSQTIHRMLKFDGHSGTFSVNEEEPLEARCVIVDETSMIDLHLMKALLRALVPGTRLLLVGDADQLPSVGAGNVLGDILQSGILPCIRLTDIFRQGETSRIVVNAHRINRGEMPLLNEKGTDFFFQKQTSFPEAAATVTDLAAARLPRFLGYPQARSLRLSAENLQVLSPTRKGECGVQYLNVLLQQALNPRPAEEDRLKYGDTEFRLGDKVIQTKNDYDIEWTRRTPDGPEWGAGIFNGDMGFITRVDPENQELTVCFDEDREVEYCRDDLQNLDLAYCLSVHKAQGSEFPVVIMPVMGGPSMLLTRNLFYTALTRAREMVVLVGREEIIRRMVENDHIARRYTTLALRLAEAAALNA